MAVLHQVYRDARRSIRFTGGGIHGEPIVAAQPYLRRVYAEFHRRLRVFDIYVEGADE